MELRVAFQRTSQVAFVLGERLNADAVRQTSRAFGRAFRDYKFSPGGESWRGPGQDRTFISGPGLWVLVKPGQPPTELPSLHDVAAFQHLDGWKDCVERFGLPNNRSLEVAELPARSYQLRYVYFEWLQTVTRRAKFLIACEQAAVGNPQSLRDEIIAFKGFRKARITIKGQSARIALHELGWDLREFPLEETLSDEVIQQFGREIIAQALAEALRSMDPVAGSEPRGISDAWGFVAQGWWPLVVLQEFAHRSRYAPTVVCACGRLAPPGRKRYCSQRCREREKKRRMRSRKAATQDRNRLRIRS